MYNKLLYGVSTGCLTSPRKYRVSAVTIATKSSKPIEVGFQMSLIQRNRQAGLSPLIARLCKKVCATMGSAKARKVTLVMTPRTRVIADQRSDARKPSLQKRDKILRMNTGKITILCLEDFPARWAIEVHFVASSIAQRVPPRVNWRTAEVETT